MIDDLKRADGVFFVNEFSTQGMLLALRQEGLAGKVKFVGFDASQALIDGLKNGEIHALVVQNPREDGLRVSAGAAATHQGRNCGTKV